MHKNLELLIKAISENMRHDDRKGFDRDGWCSFFSKEKVDDVNQAWEDYCSYRSGHVTLEDIMQHYAKQS